MCSAGGRAKNIAATTASSTAVAPSSSDWPIAFAKASWRKGGRWPEKSSDAAPVGIWARAAGGSAAMARVISTSRRLVITAAIDAEPSTLPICRVVL